MSKARPLPAITLRSSSTSNDVDRSEPDPPLGDTPAGLLRLPTPGFTSQVTGGDSCSLATGGVIDKPRLRGWLHAVAAPFAGLATMLLALYAPADLRLPVFLFALTTVLLFVVSAVYHRGSYSPRVTALLQRWDHANIFLVIAGSATPFAVAMLEPGAARTMLAVLWLGAVGGALVRLIWIRAPRWLFVPMYLALGWASAGSCRTSSDPTCSLARCRRGSSP